MNFSIHYDVILAAINAMEQWSSVLYERGAHDEMHDDYEEYTDLCAALKKLTSTI